MRRVGDQRSEHGGGAEQADHGAVDRGEQPQAAGLGDGHVAEAERKGADDHRDEDAEAVGQPPEKHAARPEAEGHQGVGERGAGARDAELGLHRGQGDDHRPHADAADGAEADGRGQAQPRVVDSTPPGGGGGRRGRPRRLPWTPRALPSWRFPGPAPAEPDGPPRA
jgi:hypothetical protein